MTQHSRSCRFLWLRSKEAAQDARYARQERIEARLSALTGCIQFGNICFVFLKEHDYATNKGISNDRDEGCFYTKSRAC